MLGLNIRTARKHAKLTQEQLAAECGASKGMISQIEKGLTLPSVSLLTRIATKLGKQEEQLLRGNAHHIGERQPTLPGLSLDERIAALPEAMREFVLIALKKAEAAARRVPEQFLRPPTNENWQAFADYLTSISIVDIADKDSKI